jgi:hypothetical protein
VVTASNSAGSTTFGLVLTVNAAAPVLTPPSALSYGTISPLLVGKATSLTPTVSGGTVSAYAVNPALPAGLALSASSGIISGTPTTVTPKATYTVTASNAKGSTSAAVNLEVDSGPTVALTVTTNPSTGLSFFWKTTDGALLGSTTGPSATWLLPQGPGIHFAYVLAVDTSGNCFESRVVVNSDSFGAATLASAPAATTQPPTSGITCNVLTDPFFNVVAATGNVQPAAIPTSTVITAITATLNGTAIGNLQQVFPAVIGSLTSEPSNAFLPANYYLTAYGEDTALSACQYYVATGAATSAAGTCDQTGNILPALTFAEWEAQVGITATHGVQSTYFINAVDLNLTREHRSITPAAGNALYAAYVCNHLPAADASGNAVTVNLPTPSAAQQPLVDAAIANAVAGKNLVACVAMDYITSANGTQFTRFFVFGPSGQLLPSVNLDQRGEKYVPGACIACHGGQTFASAQTAAIGANLLPYDINNFVFSDQPGFTEADQDANIHQLNLNLLTGPISTTASPSGITPATSALITGWFGPQGFGFVPPTWPNTPAGTSGFTFSQIYTDVVARSCRTCHTAQPATFNWDALGPTGLAIFVPFVCTPPTTAFPQVNLGMPNAIVEFNRFWDSHINQATLPPGTPDQIVEFSALKPGVACTPPIP